MQTKDGTVIIENVDSEKDLGVTIDKALSFGEHINNKISIANRNFGLIFRSFTFMDKEIFLNLYKSIVRPHLEYATSIWTPMYKKIYDSNRKRTTQSHQISQEPKKQTILGKIENLRITYTRIQERTR